MAVVAGKNGFEVATSTTKNIMVGVQHVLTMFPGSVAVPLILASAIGLEAKETAFLVSANLFTSGLAVLIQVFGARFGIGSKLPVVLGSSFAPLGPMILIGQNYGLQTLFGSIIGAALLVFILSFALNRALRLFPPVVVGSFVTMIGVSLAPVAIKDVAGGEGAAGFGSPQNLLLGLAVLLLIVLLSRFGGGVIRSLALLIGMTAGSLVALVQGTIDFSPVNEAPWLAVITPFHFGWPVFALLPIFILTLFCILNIVQCIGVFAVLETVTGEACGERAMVRGIRGQAVAQLIAGCFSSVPGTMFNENVGLLDLTKVKSLRSVAVAGMLLLLAGVFPKIGAMITVVPKAVLGGATLALFGIITAAGISILSRVDFFADSNFTVIGTSIAVGVGVTFSPQIFGQLPLTLNLLVSNGLFMVTASAILLHFALNRRSRTALQERTEKKLA